MISFKDSLPASYEVTFLPLVIAYVFFGLGMLISIYIAVIGPIIYGVMCLFFITADLLDGIDIKLLAAKVSFVLASLSPAALVTVWMSIMM
jgi:hypothetical protein